MFLCSNFEKNFHPIWKYAVPQWVNRSLGVHTSVHVMYTGTCNSKVDLLLDFKDDHSLIPEQQVYLFQGWGTQSKGNNSQVKFLKGWRSSCIETLSDWKKERGGEQAQTSYCSPELSRNVCTDNLCNICVSHSYCSAPCCKTCCYYMLYWHVYYFPTRKSLLWPPSRSCWVLCSSPGHFKNTSWKIAYKSGTRQKKKYSALLSKVRAVVHQILLPTF